MNAFNCVICASGKAPEANRLRSENHLGTQKIADELGFTRYAVRQHFEKCDTPPFATESPEKTLNLEGDNGDISVSGLSEPVKDWTELLEMWDLDPKSFEVVEPVSMAARDLASGQKLFSYRAKIRKSTPGIESLRTNFDDWKKDVLLNPARLIKSTNGSTYVIAIADPQLGKKGTYEAITNWQLGVTGHVDRIKRLISSGVAIREILIAFMGDEHEGVANNYTNQPFTVEMNLSKQLETDFDLRMWTIKYVCDEIADVAVKVSSVISNHGEFTRNGSKDPVTTKGDNSSTMITRLCQRAFQEAPGYKDIEWIIADGSPAVVIDLSGIKTYLSHGYIEKGRGANPELRQVSAMNNQILSDPLGLGDVKLFILAHYHHQWMRQDRHFTVMGCPAIEARQASEWMLEQYGVWSEPGTIGFLVGEECGTLGWDEYAFISGV